MGSFRAASITQSTLVGMPFFFFFFLIFFFFFFLFLCSHNHLALMQQGGLVETLSRVFFVSVKPYLRVCDNPAYHLMSIKKFTFFLESLAGGARWRLIETEIVGEALSSHPSYFKILLGKFS